MVQTTKYIEALDTLIEYYQGKISELEEIKKGLLVKQMQEERTVVEVKREERTVVDTQEWYDIMNNRVVRRIKYSDGTYEDEPIVP